ncbi:DNA-3-methyladenine glycosylase family protein (plasmid) [Streptomyces sp. G6]|uniref:DNA-3-methyladenine glycosylase family protein n=1 Tax=Streptomyces sp. G6 TaxID=1178736 RepID=UPI003EDA3E49
MKRFFGPVTMADPQVSDAEHELFGGPLRPTAATREHDVNPRTLDHTDTLELPVTGDGPFNALHTFWKPSHYATGLEAHTESCSWRTFRVGDLVVGVRLHAEDRTVIADIYTAGDFKPADREELTRRLISSYGLDEDHAAFAELASHVPAMREALAVLGGMRQSCPEDHFEIAVIALLLQNVTIRRTTQMTRALLAHYGHLVHFDGITLRAWFTPDEIAHVPPETLMERDRLGFRAKSLPHYAAYFRDHSTEDLKAAGNLMEAVQEIKGVGPYTAAVIASHASRDPAAFGIDVWNRKILARRLLDADDAAPETVMTRLNELFPGYAGTAGLYLVEHEYLTNPVASLLRSGPDALTAWNAALEQTGT